MVSRRIYEAMKANRVGENININEVNIFPNSQWVIRKNGRLSTENVFFKRQIPTQNNFSLHKYAVGIFQ